MLHPSDQHRYHRCEGVKTASFLKQNSPECPRLTAGAHNLVGLGWSELCPFLHGQPPFSVRGLSIGHFPEQTQRHYPLVNEKRHTPIAAAGFGEKCHHCLLTDFQGLPFFLSRAEPIFGGAHSPAGPQSLPSAGPGPALTRTGLARSPPPAARTTMRPASRPSCSGSRPGNHGNRGLQECALIEGPLPPTAMSNK